MTGDPDDLLARKSEHMDPVVGRLARRDPLDHQPHRRGIVTVNLWESP